MMPLHARAVEANAAIAGSVLVGLGRQWAFERDGYVVVAALPPRDVARLLEIFARVSSHHTGGFSATILDADVGYRAEVHTAVSAVLVPAMADVLRDYRIVCGGFAVKQPGERSRMGWHQDISLVPPTSRPALSVWAPLIDVDAENGCLQVIPGSHRWHRAPRAPGTPFVWRSRRPELDASARAVPMRAGEVLVMDNALFHGSPPNRGAHVRPVAAAPFTPTEAPLVYYHRVEKTSAAGAVALECFHVDAAFYLTHRLGVRPANLQPVDRMLEIS
jgi:hypothetical protein